MSGVAAKDKVWVGYRFVALAGTKAAKGLKIIDFGAGHASASETLCGRIMCGLHFSCTPVVGLVALALVTASIGQGRVERPKSGLPNRAGRTGYRFWRDVP